MFVQYTVDVTHRLHTNPEEDNVLLIMFESARLAGLDRVYGGTKHEYHVHQTEIGRAAIRKAQYQWGWDWGPILNTAGPWKPIVLDSYDCCIGNVRIWTHLSEDHKDGKVTANVTVVGNIRRVRLYAELVLPFGDTDSRMVLEVSVDLSRNKSGHNLSFHVANPELWWPRGYGSQALYTLHLTLLQDEYGGDQHQEQVILDKRESTFGFRQSKLVQQPNSYGTSFYFQINGVDIFCGGSNWIPADSFLRKFNYERLLDLLVESNQVMVRVWGGGIYEYDEFYDMCDKRGILVWQDFAFACASYPANDPKFLQSVEKEARQNIGRLQRHPSLVMWAGNNEDYQIKEHYDLGYDSTSRNPQSWLESKFPARYIYEELLPNLVSEYYGAREGYQAVPYQPGSPYGDPRSTTLKVDPSIGDVHQWNVWHGTMEHYQKYATMGGRFVSEFGMQAYPHHDTLRRNISGEDSSDRRSQLWPGSLTMDARNKAIGHHFRMLKYVADNFRIRELDNPVTFGHLTQIAQADAVSCAYKSWRRLWEGRLCGGALIWQLNDCWPTISWSVIDYYGVPKPAFYAIKRAMAPLAVSVQRKFIDWTTRKAGNGWQRDTGHVELNLSLDVEYQVWVASSLQHIEFCSVAVRFVSIETGLDIIPIVKAGHDISPNTTSTIFVDKALLPEERHGEQPAKEKTATQEQVVEVREKEYHVKDHDALRESQQSSPASAMSPASRSRAFGSPRHSPITIRDSRDLQDDNSHRAENRSSSVAGDEPESSVPNGKNADTKDGLRPTDIGWSTQVLRNSSPCVIHVALYGKYGDLVSTDTSWPDPIKYLEFPNRQIVLNVENLLPDKLSGKVSVTAGKPVKGFVFVEKVGGIRFSDNGFDVIPGEANIVSVERQTVGGPWPELEYTYVGRDIWE
ncbi:hypothetical protein Sste5346_009020 [Sporothrix stenoceras]|uniref:Beta-mannosidase n=1 Tax=Sporothrix stenoceras TaxID=5173 RepID=A0ABR3YMI1_9PEZI